MKSWTGCSIDSSLADISHLVGYLRNEAARRLSRVQKNLTLSHRARTFAPPQTFCTQVFSSVCPSCVWEGRCIGQLSVASPKKCLRPSRCLLCFCFASSAFRYRMLSLHHLVDIHCACNRNVNKQGMQAY